MGVSQRVWNQVKTKGGKQAAVGAAVKRGFYPGLQAWRFLFRYPPAGGWIGGRPHPNRELGSATPTDCCRRGTLIDANEGIAVRAGIADARGRIGWKADPSRCVMFCP